MLTQKHWKTAMPYARLDFFKSDERMKPRLIVYDIPVKLSEEKIMQMVVEQNNLPQDSASNIRPFFVAPSWQ